MKKISIKNNIFMIGKKNGQRKLDYYLKMRDGREYYMFTRDHSASCYEICKSAIPVNKVLQIRNRNTAIMGLVKYLNFMMPYFVEYYGLKKCS